MKPHYLTPLFEPQAIVLYQSDDKELSSASSLLHKALHASAYSGSVEIVEHQQASGYSPLMAKAQPDLALIAVGEKLACAALEHAALLKVRAAIIFDVCAHQTAELQRIAKKHGIYLVGPGSSGIHRPKIALNASIAGDLPESGGVALISQSGALTTAMLDWAKPNAMKFSAVIATGRSSNIDVADLIDFLGQDSQTQSIVIYMETVTSARRFLTALRAAARAKPVIILKAGRRKTGLQAAESHSGALVGSDDVFDAALRRSGAVRVDSFEQLFSAAKCLDSRYKLVGNRLAVISNGGGPGVIAADYAELRDLTLPELSAQTQFSLRNLLPKAQSLKNPIDLGEQANAGDFASATSLLSTSDEIDGVLVIVTPKPSIDSNAVALGASAILRNAQKPVLGCWMGEPRVLEIRRHVSAEGLPIFAMPEQAIDGFSNIATYYKNQQLLMQSTPRFSIDSEHPVADVAGARQLITAAIAKGRTTLSELETLALLQAFHIPVIQSNVAGSVPEAIALAKRIGYPVALKINAADIAHKSQMGGVRLDIANDEQLNDAYDAIVNSVAQLAPDVLCDGVIVQKMFKSRHGREFFVGMLSDPVFGPAITVGAGGTMIEIIKDRSVALPPLNRFLARSMINDTRSAEQLHVWLGMPPAKQEALELVLLRVSEMICELPELKALDINPVIIDENGVMVVDARAIIAPAAPSTTTTASTPYAHMAILPYPDSLTRTVVTRGDVHCELRAIRPEDAAQLQTFARELSPQARYFRFLSAMRELTPSLLARFTQIDYDRDMAIVAVINSGAADETMIGVARYAINPDGETAEFGLAVADNYTGRGVGSTLMKYLAQIAGQRGLKAVVGMVLASNRDMLKLMSALGYAIEDDPEDASLKLVYLDTAQSSLT